MSLASGYAWTHKNIRLLGYSMAGITTSIGFPDADVLFDVGQGLPWQTPFSNILLTHGHMDHASGIPYLIGQKAMSSQLPPTVVMPRELIQPMRDLMRIWEKVEDHTYGYHFEAAEADREYPLKTGYFAKTFSTHHRVPSTGYTVYEKRKHLKAEYKDLDRNQLIDLRRQRIEIEEYKSEPLVSFTGDTKIEFLENNPDVVRSRVLLTEVTFVDKAKTVENARHWGHLHLDELLPRLENLKCEKIVIIHVSARYSSRAVREILDARLPEHVKSKVELFPRPI